MKAHDLAIFLSYAEDNLDLTVIPTSELNRLKEIERWAKAMFEDKRIKILKQTIDNAPKV